MGTPLSRRCACAAAGGWIWPRARSIPRSIASSRWATWPAMRAPWAAGFAARIGSPRPARPRSGTGSGRGASWYPAWMPSCAGRSPSMASPSEEYLRQLRHELRRDPLLARRVIEEAADHLAEIVAAERRQGMSQHEAEEAAVRRFGPAGPLARQFDGFSLPLRVMLGLASLMTLAVAAWLASVIAFVLPRHDPARIPMWTGIAFGFVI